MLIKILIILGFIANKVFGNIVCEQCTCCKGSYCNRNGVCTYGCLAGYWGNTCQYKCPDNCESCDWYNQNICDTCKAGYYNAWSASAGRWINDCSLKCPNTCYSCKIGMYFYCSYCKDGFYNNGWYDNCSSPCYEGCKACTSANECTDCKDGYYSLSRTNNDCSGKCYHQCESCLSYENCNECKNGYYGPFCQYKCSMGCRENVCNKDNGYCNCLSTYWGQTCNNTCSTGCMSLKCDKDTGKCVDGCKESFMGEYCNVCDSGFTSIDGKCSNCNNNCDTCSDEGLCTSCKQTYGGIDCGIICPLNCNSCDSEQSCKSCTKGHYGKTCSAACPPNCFDDICDMASGVCLRCKNGFTGNTCSAKCPENCFEENCTVVGTCYTCIPGFYGSLCDITCPENCTKCVSSTYCTSCLTGFYGNICEKTCFNCLDGTQCNKNYGVCDNGCKDGWFNSYCTETCSLQCKACQYTNYCTKCPDGLYGKYNWNDYLTCEFNCSHNCSNNTCDETTGRCTAGCVKGNWGNDCSRKCPENCLNNMCFQYNGSCILGCNNGFEGYACDCPVNCFCNTYGECIACKADFKNIDNDCMCKNDTCEDNICSSCSSNLFYPQGGFCCQCSTNCKYNACLSALNCSYGCKPGYYGYNCATKCEILDQWCLECPIEYGQKQYGCNVCKPGYYPTENINFGYDRCTQCEKTCLDSECDASNGKCIKGCIHKKWGHTCKEDCPNNCLKCNRDDGNCSVCEGGKYLTDCSRSCSATCNTTKGVLFCAIETGACLNGCVTLSTYGKHCEKNCSSNCTDNVCDWMTGECVNGCNKNHWGKQCEQLCGDNCKEKEGTNKCNVSNGHCLAGCIDGYFSEQCDKQCSMNCLNTSCDYKGKCIHGCSGDFVDNSCIQVKFKSMQEGDGSKATIGGLVGGAVALVIIVVIAVVVFKRRHRKDESSAKKENHHSNNAVRFSEVAERGRQTDIQDSVPVYSTPDKSKIKKDTTQPHTVNNPNYQKPSVALKQSVIGKVAAVYENAVLREVEDSKPESDTSLSHENLTRASKARQSLGKYLQELEDPDENAGSSSAALVLASTGSHVKESEVGDTYYNTAEVFKRKIPLDKLAEFVDNKTRECFEEEFKLLPEGLIKKYTESQKKDNITKNRYRGIYPYDDTRVVLRDGESDYINASYIDGYKKLKAYIASLGPTYKYMDDMSAFWRMVWQEKCGKIIMLTNLMEGGTRKCDQYWPEKDSSQLYADINVTCLSEETYADYTVRVFNIQKDSAKRTVTQVHFTAWPDQGVPDDVTCLIEFRHRVVSVKTNLDGPILVHCSAGIGRTGTYIALDSLTKEGESEGSVDIYACVRNMREQRVNMIQTAEQYEYLHRAVVHSLTFDSHAIHLNHFQQYMKSHDIKTLAQKFQDLEHSVEKRSKDENEAIKKNSAIKEKNRVGADIPGDRNRPRLYLILKPEASDYINALYVNSYRHVNRFLLAQTPLPGTVDDFLTLIVQEKCSCIVSIEPETNKSKDVGIYYPADNQTLKRGSFTVRTERVSSSQNFTHRRLTISNHGKAGNEDHTVQHFQLTSWVDAMKCPEDAASFLDFLHHVELKSGGPVLVHCLTGAEKCGLFCVVSILLEKLQCDQEVSVVNTVRQVKSRRHRVIPNQEQYIFCHQCVNEYIRSFDNYSNFASRQ